MKKFQRYFQFLLIVLSAGSIYPLIFLRSGYQETILAVFNLSAGQLNNIYTILGLAFVFGYFPSGWLADRFPAKKLLTLSLLMCGLAGLWFAQIPSHTSVLFIYMIWGIFSVFTFWSAHLRIVKLISSAEEEGRFFGVLDGGRGIVEAGLATGALFIFNRLSGGTDASDVVALQGVIYLYSFTMLLISMLVMLFVKEGPKSDEARRVDDESASQKKLGKEFISDMRVLMANKYVWLMGFIICFSYAVYWMIFYVGGFLQTNINISAIRVAGVMVVSLWMRPIGGIVGGFLADRFNKNMVLAIALISASSGLLALAVLPVTMPQLLFEGLVVYYSLMVFIVRGVYWSLLGACKIDVAMLGLGIGFISLIAYLPDVGTPLINSALLGVFGETVGQNAFLIYGAVLGTLGVMLIFVFNGLLKKERHDR